MSTVQEIESAIEQLSPEQKFKIHRWLEDQFNPPRPEGYFADDYEAMSRDVERMQLEQWSLKVPQSSDR